MSAAAVGLLDSERSREADGAETCEEIVAAAWQWCGILAEYFFFLDKTPQNYNNTSFCQLVFNYFSGVMLLFGITIGQIAPDTK